jgi:hypothetical protein
MKQFLIRLIKFLLCILILNAIVFFVVMPSKQFEWFKLPPKRNILVAGDSRTERSINDSIFARAVNISQSAELYLYTYAKLRNLLPSNPHIDTVFLSFSYPSLTRLTDKWFKDDLIINHRIGSYLPLMTFQESVTAFLMNPKGYAGAMLITYQKYIEQKFSKSKITSFHDLNIGGYLFIGGDINNSDVDRVVNFTEKLQTHSVQQIEYLIKINKLCKQYHVKLFLIIAPIHHRDKYRSQTRTMLQTFKTEFEEIPVLDYANLSLPDSCFRDATHLNFKGAKIFSERLSKRKFQ